MGAQTHIAWCDSTVNFWSICTPCGPGCINCYAAELSRRYGWGEYRRGVPRHKFKSAVKQAFSLNRKPWVCDECGEAVSNIRLRSGADGDPSEGWCDACGGNLVTWHRRRIFSLSLGDWLDPEVPTPWLAEMLDTIRQCDACDWLLLTKRPERFDQRMIEVWHCESNVGQKVREFCHEWRHGRNVPSNVWIGASVEDQAAAEKRIPELLRIPAAVRFLSCEPLLGPIDFSKVRPVMEETKPGIGWIIVGGESGTNARPMKIEWIQSIADQCTAAGVPLFVKQDNGHKPGMQGRIPNELWKRKEFPEVAR